MGFLLLLFVTFATAAQTLRVKTMYADATCTDASLRGIYMLTDDCVPDAVTPVCNSASTYYWRDQCVNATVNDLLNTSYTRRFSYHTRLAQSSETCENPVGFAVYAALNNTCITLPTSNSSYKITCNNETLIQGSWGTGACEADTSFQSWSLGCHNCGAPTVYCISYCAPAAGDELPVGPKDAAVKCIHEDSVFDPPYASIGCVVPHRVVSDGLAIYTKCLRPVRDARPLRVTGDHLVFTANGRLVQAQHLRVGDVLVGADVTDSCVVHKIVPIYQQTFIGLNCPSHDRIRADGVLVSTFGTLHTLPAAWMYYGSRILGTQRASDWGDVLAKALLPVAKAFLLV